MGYIEELRKRVGHYPLLMVGAAVLIVDSLDRLLLLKRSDNDCWGVPGGAVEPGETVEESARREVQEETGLKLAGMTLLDVFSGQELFYVYPNGDKIYNITVAYLSRRAGGQIRLNAEHSAWDWFEAGNLPDSLSPPIRPVIERYKKTVVP